MCVVSFFVCFFKSEVLVQMEKCINQKCIQNKINRLTNREQRVVAVGVGDGEMGEIGEGVRKINENV